MLVSAAIDGCWKKSCTLYYSFHLQLILSNNDDDDDDDNDDSPPRGVSREWGTPVPVPQYNGGIEEASVSTIFGCVDFLVRFADIGRITLDV